MVYRYESDEDAFMEYPEPGSDRSVLGAGPPPPAGPSPSRFPTPSLPRANRVVLPSAEPEPVRAAAPASPPPHAQPPSSPQPYTQVQSPPPVEPPATVEATAPAGPPPPRRGGGRLWQVLVGGAAVLVLLALCGLAAAALLDERDQSPQATSTGRPEVAESAGAEAHDLDSRDTDQAPLTAKEVFPGKQLVVADGQPAYRVLKTHSSASCAVAATGEVADLLVRLGCNQVVRATLRTPDGDLLVTTGLFNLTDRANAERARDRIRLMLDERQGRFRGMAADDDSEAVATAPARVGWQVRGHYLAYAVVARADGETIRSGDIKAREVLFDMIELHLNRGVLERRADGGTAGQPTDEGADRTGTQDGGELPGE
ncbi:hypothetical protein GA0070606_4001 [Micromonospora citrea]|uniref:Uncharacterized protein n=1 Tax=Micromonospora citrea TaxID=47855 RepID=A0A1C6VE29_9ACTN|nr:hypothetical protein [Micromonospora citrea]SCL64596.1 hypothetical protein GA0070606_4001 [Micromonospora citrea]